MPNRVSDREREWARESERKVTNTKRNRKNGEEIKEWIFKTL